MNEATKRKISEKLKGRHPVNEFKMGNKVNLGRKHTETWKIETSKRMTGHIVSIKTREKLSIGIKKYYKEYPEAIRAGEKNPFYGKYHTIESLEKMRQSSLGRNTKENHWNYKGGKPHCKECGKLLASYYAAYCQPCWLAIFMQGGNNPRWKGGITTLTNAIRTCFEYRQWRSDVFTRDNFTCQKCGDAIGGNLVAHHIVEFADIIERYEITTLKEALKCEELWNINNGQTLCDDCHIEEHRVKNYGYYKISKAAYKRA